MLDSRVNFRHFRQLGIGAIMAITIAAVYWQAITHAFINYDDTQYVTDNPMVQRGLTERSISWAFRTNTSGNWIPVTWLSHMLDCQLHGLRPSGHHGTSILIHTANTWLLFSLLARMTSATWRSGLVAILFGLHPLHVESVAWVAERKDVLSTFFGLLCLIAYVRYSQVSKSDSAKSKIWFALSLLMFALGLMSKPMLVTLPFVMLLLDYWPLRRVTVSQATNLSGATAGSAMAGGFPTLRVISGKADRALLMEKIPFFVLVAASCAAALLAQEAAGAVQSLHRLPVGLRFQNAVVSYALYVVKTLWPSGLAVIYPYPDSIPIWKQGLSWVFLLGASAVALRSWLNRPWIMVGWLWFLGMLVPVIGLVQVGSQAMADRYTYLPSVGLFLVLAWELGRLAERGKGLKLIVTSIASATVIACAATTHLQLQYWKSSLALFSHALDMTVNNRIAHNNLGIALAAMNRNDEAISHYREALRISGEYDDARINLGIALTRQNNFDEAQLQLSAVLNRRPDTIAHIALGNIFEYRGRPDEAINQYRAALALQPGNAYAHYNLANILARRGELKDAIYHYSSALEAKPDWAAVRLNVAGLMLRLGRLDDALLQSQAALLIEPTSAESHYYIGIISAQQRKFSTAVAHLRQAIQLRPDWLEALNSLAWVLATSPEAQSRNGPEAVRLATQAAELSKRTNVTALDVLGASLAEVGLFEEAIEVATLAKTKAEVAGQEQLAKRIQARQTLYQSRQPYRE